MIDYDDVRVGKNNRRDVQQRQKTKRGSILRMGQMPPTAHDGISSGSRKAMDIIRGRRAAEKSRDGWSEVEVDE